MGHPTRPRSSSRAAFGCVLSTAGALLLLAGCTDGKTLRSAPVPTRSPTTMATVTVTVTQGPVAAAPSGQPVPGRTGAQPASTPTPLLPAAPPTGQPRDTAPRFDTCAEALARGFGPYTRGADPEYFWYTDDDGDGVVCEREP